MIRRSSLFILFVLACSVFAQEANKVIRVRPSGGLNTIADDFSMPLEDARVAHNIDFSANIGGITVRKNYDSISALSATNWDSLVSIYGAYYSDGSQQLFAVADSVGVGYGNVIFGAKGSSSIASPTVAMGYWSIQNKTKFAMADDRVYAVNGQQNGFVWDGRNARRWPLSAPGEPTICPLQYTGVSSYKLNGEYRYSILIDSYWDNGATTIRGNSYVAGADLYGQLSSPVQVSNGRVLLTHFTFPTYDSAAAADSVIDSARYYIVRTKANVSPLDAADKIYYVARIHSIGKTFDSFTVDGGTAVRTFFIDSIPDASLSEINGYPAIQPQRYGRIKSGLNESKFGYSISGRFRRPSAPTYISKVDSTIAAYRADSTHKVGLMLGLPRGASMAGWAWVVTLTDTVNAIESDTTRSLFVLDTFSEGTGTSVSKPFQITIGLPKVSSAVTGVMKNVYRAPVWVQGHDTLVPHAIAPEGSIFSKLVDVRRWRKKLIFDSVSVGAYYLVATVPSTDTLYTDNTRYDSLILKETYRYSTPRLLNNIFSFENRMYGNAGSNLYFSVLDTVTRWGAFDFLSVNKDDGDIITTAYPSRGIIRVLKNRSNYNIFQGSDLGWNRTEVSGYFGCIAPNSHVATVNGHYYVSDIGVIRETEGANLERTQSIENVSIKLKQFADFSVETARKINAFAIPSEGKVLFSLPDNTTGVGTGDTTYVYDERTNTWATWDGIVFADATLYGAETNANFIPGDSMYFIQPGSRTLFRYGSGSASTWVWESAPIGIENTSFKQVSDVGVWGDNLSSTFGIQGTFKDETGTNVTTPPVELGTLVNGYKRFSFPPDVSSSLYHRLRVVGSATGSIRAFDIYQSELGEKEAQ